MKVLVTGAEGFIGKNLCVRLEEEGFNNLLKVGRQTPRACLSAYLQEADFVFHLAGVNRPECESEFKKGNADLTEFIVTELERSGKNIPVMISSSTQADIDNAYGTSKLKAERFVQAYGEDTGAKYYIYRLPNVFGKWCRPNYNSFVATFCHNTVNNIEINIHDHSAPVELVYVDDVCNELISLLSFQCSSGFNSVQPSYQTTVGDVADLLKLFQASRDSLITENVGVGFPRALYSTYLSYFSPKEFKYEVPSYGDERGIFCEMLKTKEAGQFSFFTAHPGITRGGHYHHSKNEKFLIIKGEALFKFEHILTGERYELRTSSNTPEIVETVPGWSHDITNIGDDELVVMLWANEIFDRNAPDTVAKPL